MKLDLRRIGHPFVARLSHELKAPVFLSAPLQGRSIIVDVVWPVETDPDPVLVVGRIHPIRQSACGKVCAAFSTQEERFSIEALVRKELDDAEFEAWRRELEAIRETRLAVRQESKLIAVAAPVFRAGGVFTGAVGLYFPDREQISAEVTQEVKRTEKALSFALGQPFSN